MEDNLQALLERRPELIDTRAAIEQAYRLIVACYRQGGKLLFCGNGGSAADSEHLVGELMKGYLLRRPVSAEVRRRLQDTFPELGDSLADNLQGALPAISLVSQTALLTAYANDVDPGMIFAQQVLGYGKPGDVLVAISTSGRSKNVVNAARVAKALGLWVVAFTGESGGDLRALSDALVAVPGEQTAAIQERHLSIYHALCAMIEREFFSE